MTYRISINDSSFIAPSQLGFEANNGINLYKDFQITGTDLVQKMKFGLNHGEKTNLSVIIIMKWLSI